MADEHGPVGSKRGFLFIFLVGLVTLGIYWIYWFYKTNKEVKEYARLPLSPVWRVIYLVFGSVILFPPLYAYYVWLRDVNDTAKKEGLSGVSPVLNLILLFIPFGAIYTMYRVQATLNNIWDAANRKASAPAAVAAAPEPEAEEEADVPVKSARAGGKMVKCPRCKTKNTPDHNYCVKCGQEL